MYTQKKENWVAVLKPSQSGKIVYVISAGQAFQDSIPASDLNKKVPRAAEWLSLAKSIAGYVCKDIAWADIKQHNEVTAQGDGTYILHFELNLVPGDHEITPENKFSIDLKWSCWSAEKSYFPKNVWDAARAAFLGKGLPVLINTAPRKEIHFGSVTIAKGVAAGYFYNEFDEEYAAYNQRIDFNVEARSFPELMRKIDEQENVLLGAIEKASKQIDEDEANGCLVSPDADPLCYWEFR